MNKYNFKIHTLAYTNKKTNVFFNNINTHSKTSQFF